MNRLVGDNGQARAALDFVQEGGKIGADIGMISRLSDQRGGNRRIAPLRREDDGPLGGGPAVSQPWLLQQRFAFADIDWNAAQHALKSIERCTDGQSTAIDTDIHGYVDSCAPVRFLMTETALRT